MSALVGPLLYRKTRLGATQVSRVNRRVGFSTVYCTTSADLRRILDTVRIPFDFISSAEHSSPRVRIDSEFVVDISFLTTPYRSCLRCSPRVDGANACDGDLDVKWSLGSGPARSCYFLFSRILWYMRPNRLAHCDTYFTSSSSCVMGLSCSLTLSRSWL